MGTWASRCKTALATRPGLIVADGPAVGQGPERLQRKVVAPSPALRAVAGQRVHIGQAHQQVAAIAADSFAGRDPQPAGQQSRPPNRQSPVEGVCGPPHLGGKGAILQPAGQGVCLPAERRQPRKERLGRFPLVFVHRGAEPRRACSTSMAHAPVSHSTANSSS